MAVPFEFYKKFSLGNYSISQTIEGVNGVASLAKTNGKFYNIIDMNRTASASALQSDPGEFDYYEAWRWNASEIFALDPEYKPKNALVIGIGHGYLVDALLDIHSIKEITVVDLSSEVVDLVKLNTKTDTSRIFSDPRVKIIIGDARRYVQKAASQGAKYDMIQNKINEPWHAGSGNLFTVEFFTSLKSILSKGGYLSVRPLAGHARDGLEVFDSVIYPGYYHIYFKNGPFKMPNLITIDQQLAEYWFKVKPGSDVVGPRRSSLEVVYLKSNDSLPLAYIANNTDDKPLFEYFFYRQLVGSWKSPRISLDAKIFNSQKFSVPVIVR